MVMFQKRKFMVRRKTGLCLKKHSDKLIGHINFAGNYKKHYFVQNLYEVCSRFFHKIFDPANKKRFDC